MKRHSIHILVSIFLGFAVGFFAHGAMMRYRFQNFEENLPEILSRRLDLNDTQNAQVKNIVEGSFKQFDEIKTDFRPRMRGLQMATRERIAEVLDENQKKKFQEFTTELDKRQEERRAQSKEGRGPRRYSPF